MANMSKVGNFPLVFQKVDFSEIGVSEEPHGVTNHAYLTALFVLPVA